MNPMKSTLSTLVLGLLLMAVLVGVASDGREVNAAAGSRQVIVPASYFAPNREWIKYLNNGNYLKSNDTVPVRFYGPVQFPVAFYATVEKVELMAYDNTNSGRIRLWLYKTKPAAGNRIEMAAIDTGVTYTSTTDPHFWADSTINDFTVNPAEQAWLELEIDPDVNLWVYGVRVWYHPGL